MFVDVLELPDVQMFSFVGDFLSRHIWQFARSLFYKERKNLKAKLCICVHSNVDCEKKRANVCEVPHRIVCRSLI